MADLIIICGLPGTGKTTIANELSKWLKTPVLHKDHFKEKLYELLSMNSLEDSKKLGVVSIELMFSIVQRYIENGVDIIIEAPFMYDADLETFHSWQKQYPNLNVISIICSVDNSVRYKRFINRDRHEAHHDLERDSVKILNETIPVNYEKFPGKHITINTEEELETILKKVVLFIAE